MVPPNLNFYSISTKDSLEFQKKHALGNRFLRALLCSNAVFNPGCNRKNFIRKSTPLPDKIVLNMNSCFIQYNAPFFKYVNRAQKINSFCRKLLVFCQLQINLNVFEVQNVSVTVHENIEILWIRI